MAVRYYNDPYNSSPDYSKYPGQGNQGSWFEKNRGFLNFLGGLFEGAGNFLGSRSERKQRESELEFEREKFRAEQARRAAIARQVRPLFENLKGLDFGSVGGQSFGQPLSEQERLRKIFGGM